MSKSQMKRIWAMAPELVQEIRNDALEEAARVADRWAIPSYMKLKAGEMSAQEVRTAKAIASGIASEISAIKKMATA